MGVRISPLNVSSGSRIDALGCQFPAYHPIAQIERKKGDAVAYPSLCLTALLESFLPLTR